MTFGNLASRPDLSCCFGSPLPQGQDALLRSLAAVEVDLEALAAEATEHVGAPFQSTGLRVSEAGIHGGPTGASGDLWFDVSHAPDRFGDRSSGPPWLVTSTIVVCCGDHPEPQSSSNTHSLAEHRGAAWTPAATIALLASHVALVANDLRRLSPSLFRDALHETLP